jgi:ABC-type transport system involved in multi-copper enzyme maturation permease subunit
MLWIIAKKQLLDNILSLRFSIALVLCFVLMVFSTFMSIEDYARQVGDLSDFLRPDQYKEEAAGHRDIPRLGEGPTPVTRRIPTLKVLSRGLGDDTSLIVTIRPFVGAIYGQKAFVTNTTRDLFPTIDLVLVVNVVVSLLAMTFTYDSISGEKANGTLKLLLSNSVPRYQILLGKSLGSYISFLMSYVPSLIGVALLMMLHPKIALTGSQWWAVVLIFVISIIYAKVFSCLGLLVSCRTKDPKTSLLTLLAAWAFLALIIPNFSPYLAAEIHPARTPYEIEAELNSIGFEEAEAAWDRVREFMGPALEERLREIMISRNLKPAPGGSWNLDYGTWSDGARWIIRDIEDEDTSNELQWSCSRSSRKELRNVTSRSLKVKNDHISSIRQQMALSKAFSALSPVAAFTYLATDLANTGIRDEGHFRGTVDVFKNEFVAYVGEKLANQKFLDRPDVSDMPSFRYEPFTAVAITRDDLIHLLLLALFSIVFFLCAHLSFLRYDVR